MGQTWLIAWFSCHLCPSVGDKSLFIPKQKLIWNLSITQKTEERAEDTAKWQSSEPSKCEAPGSTPSTAKEKQQHPVWEGVLLVSHKTSRFTEATKVLSQGHTSILKC